MGPGHEHQITSPSLLHHPKEQGLAALDSTGRKGHSSKEKRRSRSSDGRKGGKGTRRRRRSSEEEQLSGIQSPVSEKREGSREARDRRRRRRRKRGTQSLPRDALRNYDSETDRRAVRGRKREKDRERNKSRERKSRSEESVRKAESEELQQAEEQEVPSVEGVTEEKVEEVEKIVSLERQESEGENDVFLPVPSPNQKLPRPKETWGVEIDENWDMAAEYKELRREKEQERSQDDQTDDDAPSVRIERPLPSVAVRDVMSQSKSFSFLTSTLSVEQLEDDESDSGGSQSDSVSAASISGLSVAGAVGRGAQVLPGPWLPPSQQRVAQVMQGNGRPGMRTEQGGERGAIS